MTSLNAATPLALYRKGFRKPIGGRPAAIRRSLINAMMAANTGADAPKRPVLDIDYVSACCLLSLFVLSERVYWWLCAMGRWQLVFETTQDDGGVISHDSSGCTWSPAGPTVWQVDEHSQYVAHLSVVI